MPAYLPRAEHRASRPAGRRSRKVPDRSPQENPRIKLVKTQQRTKCQAHFCFARAPVGNGHHGRPEEQPRGVPTRIRHRHQPRARAALKVAQQQLPGFAGLHVPCGKRCKLAVSHVQHFGIARRSFRQPRQQQPFELEDAGGVERGNELCMRYRSGKLRGIAIGIGAAAQISAKQGVFGQLASLYGDHG